MLEILRDIAEAVRESIKTSEKSLWAEEEGIGADGTRTHHIDRIAEDAVISFLEELGNPFNLLSEEGGFLDFGREYTLILDPVDGTYNAIRSIPFYSISLALSRSSMAETEYALIMNLSTGEEFHAEKGKGAYRNGYRIKTGRFSPEDSIFSVMLGKRAHEDSYIIAGIPKRLRSIGSASIEMAYVASGSLDLYYYRGKGGGLRVMDVAAGALILREAGGEVYNHELIPLNMDLDIRKRTSVIAVGDKRLLEVIL